MKNSTMLHLGNGTVYLSDWINIDISGPLAIDRPDIVERNKTTVDKYYKYGFRENRDSFVTDVIMDVRSLSGFANGSVSKILSVNLIDHMTKKDFFMALLEWNRVLEPGGEMVIDVDDRREQARMLVNAKSVDEIDWCMRMIYCDHAAEGRTHFWGYTEETIRDIVDTAGGFSFNWCKTDFIKHDVYPAIQLSFSKI